MDDGGLKNSDSEGASYRDVLYTVDSHGNRKWVYPEIVWGRFLKVRTVIAYLLMLIYLGAPWVRINGKPLILLNLTDRKFTFFGIDFWATDTIFLMFFLTSLGLTLFLVTAILGRVWCGWACPETVFLEFLFRPIERLCEGNPSQRKRLDAAPWNLEKILRKGAKHVLSAFCAALVANTALAYFIGTEKLIEVMTHSPADNPVLFGVMVFMMGLMAFQFGWFREQFCTVLCPYARFQSVMLDPDTLVIGYDQKRGEPRGKKKDSSAGDCVDCKLCVRVCPTGIDIRNGLQLECINCAQCIDACDSIMRKVGRPEGLIRYDTERKLLGGERKFFRPRLFVYIFILALYGSAFLYFLKERLPYDYEVIREAKGALFTVSDDGRIVNQFKLRVSNKSDTASQFRFMLLEEDAFLKLIMPMKDFEVQPGQILDLPLFVNFDNTILRDKNKKSIHFKIQNIDSVSQRVVSEVEKEMNIYGKNN